MEFCANGDLKSAIKLPRTSVQKRQKWAVQIAQAMTYLHSRSPPVVHRDIKPENILLDQSNNAKVTDFGLSKIQEEGRDMTVNIGTMAYMPPEVMALNSDQQTANIDGTKWDVFSFAVMTTFVISGSAPFQALDNQKIFVSVCCHDARTPIPPALDDYPGLRALIERMWIKQPDQRPSFDEITSELRRMFGDFDQVAKTRNDSNRALTVDE